MTRIYSIIIIMALLTPLALADVRGIANSPSPEAFETRFGLRREMITGHNALLAAVGHSGSPQVIMGRGGWLFFNETLGDYTGQALLDADIAYIADKLTLMAAHAWASGSTLIVLIAPNKASIYPEHMPAHIRAGEGGNRAALEAALATRGAAVLPAYDLLMEAKTAAPIDTLYHREDSHWNNAGAALIANALLDMAGVDHMDYSAMTPQGRADWDGDLYHMLYPARIGSDVQYYYDMSGVFSSKRPIHTGEELLIETVGEGEHTLFMVRDSFANNLVPFLAEAFGEAAFTRSMTAYDMPEDAVVVIEIAERRIPELLEAFTVSSGEPGGAGGALTVGALYGVSGVALDGVSGISASHTDVKGVMSP